MLALEWTESGKGHSTASTLFLLHNFKLLFFPFNNQQRLWSTNMTSTQNIQMFLWSTQYLESFTTRFAWGEKFYSWKDGGAHRNSPKRKDP